MNGRRNEQQSRWFVLYQPSRNYVAIHDPIRWLQAETLHVSASSKNLSALINAILEENLARPVRPDRHIINMPKYFEENQHVRQRYTRDLWPPSQLCEQKSGLSLIAVLLLETHESRDHLWQSNKQLYSMATAQKFLSFTPRDCHGVTRAWPLKDYNILLRAGQDSEPQRVKARPLIPDGESIWRGGR